VKKRTLLPQDLGIAQRLREARNHLNLSQGDVARQLGISRERLASYEDARTPIRFELALRFCWQFVFSENWLALGEKEIVARMDKKAPDSRHVWIPHLKRMCMSLLFDPIFHKMKPGVLFAEAYEKDLDSVYNALFLGSIRSGRIAPHILVSGEANEDQLKHYFHALMEIRMGDLKTPFEKYRFLTSIDLDAHEIQLDINGGYLTKPEKKMIMLDAWHYDKLPASVEEGTKEMEAFIENEKEHFLERLSSGSGLPKFENKKAPTPLDNVSVFRNLEAVKAKYSELLERLKSATSPRGKKTELANFLGVKLPRISQWLAREYEPGAETTLRMLQWVEHQERQK
jgi:DNA-binding XRE family transcriptional regulator